MVAAYTTSIFSPYLIRRVPLVALAVLADRAGHVLDAAGDAVHRPLDRPFRGATDGARGRAAAAAVFSRLFAADRQLPAVHAAVGLGAGHRQRHHTGGMVPTGGGEFHPGARCGAVHRYRNPGADRRDPAACAGGHQRYLGLALGLPGAGAVLPDRRADRGRTDAAAGKGAGPRKTTGLRRRPSARVRSAKFCAAARSGSSPSR